MTDKYQVFVISHTHWDREWYGSFQLFRVRLVRMLNKLLAILDANEDYKTFNLDGQTIILEDYLEIHPEMRDTLKKHIHSGRLMVGPWYILPDEFLTSAESLVRNLLLGDKMATEFGHRMEVGYIPDTFGHIAQLPQILQGFGLDTCMNFRGLDSGNRQSELWWESPDGSRVLLHHMSTEIGYSDLGAMAENPQRAAYDLRATAYYKAERATAKVLLAMQGVDHVEARDNLSMIINMANDTFDDMEFVHASLEDFWSALKLSVVDKDLETVYGELRDVPRTEGSMNFLLYNVLSSRVDNKIHNAKTLISLENWAEPWATLAWIQDIADYPQGHLWTAWKWLLKNHPHDSIGGCSVDEVHRQMTTRFEWAQEIADYLTEERFRLYADQIDYDAHEDELAITVFNAVPWERDEVITIDIELPDYWLKQQALANLKPVPELTMDSHYLDVKDVNTRADWLYGMPNLPEIAFRGVHIRSHDGEAIPVQIHNIEKTTTALALASGPRGVIDIHRVRASFRAKVPAYGYASYYVKTDPKPTHWTKPKTIDSHILQNEYLTVTVQTNSTFDMHVKDLDSDYKGLGLLEDSGDNGDGYTFSPPPFNRIYTSHGQQARISRIGNDVAIQHICIEYDLALPISLDDARQKRVDTFVNCPIQIDLILRDGSKCLEVNVKVDNCAKDHRLRMRFPVPCSTDITTSAMQFDAVTRPIKPQDIEQGEWWVEDAPETFPMHGWVDVSTAESGGLTVIAEGLHEFAVGQYPSKRDIAITLLRSVGYLGARTDPTTIIGGAGPGIPTPEAQLQKSLSFRMCLFPHQNTWDEAEVWREAQAFLNGVRSITVIPNKGTQSTINEGIRVKGKNTVLSSIKQSEDSKAIILRLYNPSDNMTTASLHFPTQLAEAFLTDLQENSLESLTIEAQSIQIVIPKKKIVTIKAIIREKSDN